MITCPRCTKSFPHDDDVHTCTPAPMTEEELRATFDDPRCKEMGIFFERVRATALQALADVADLEKKLIRADEVLHKTVTEGIK